MIFNDLNLTKPCQKGVWGVIKTHFFFCDSTFASNCKWGIREINLHYIFCHPICIKACRLETDFMLARLVENTVKDLSFVLSAMLMELFS